ncbi:MAG: 50S ribosomal protein L25/general stress protein Ctc [Rickettsiales bacterium]|nr:50S ribosomal protein L25/general stress protein Ctc [Rickettsiales bacterium]
MEAAYTFDAELRESHGKGSARALRREKKVPAIIYNKDMEPVSVSMDRDKLTHAYFRGGFTSKVVEIKAGKDTYHALPRQLQLHPVTDMIEHADFLRVTDKSTINVNIPVNVLNADRCVGVKRGGSINVVRHTVELVCNVTRIPTSVDVDVKDAHIGDSIHISEVDLPEGVTPTITDRDFTIVTIAGRLAKASEPSADEAAVAEEPAEGAAAEGEAA